MARSGGGVGTNQYQVKGRSRADRKQLPLLAEMLLWPQSDRVDRAKDEGTSPQLLARLAHDPDVAVRLEIAFNPSTPADALIHLAADSQPEVRSHLAVNEQAPAAALGLLYDQEIRQRTQSHPEIFPYLAVHPNTPGRVLLALTQNLGGRKNRLVENLAYNPGCPAEALKLLADYPDRRIRRLVSSHPNVTVDTIELLVDDADHRVRCWALRNRRCPPEILRRKSRTASGRVCQTDTAIAIAGNLNTPPDVLVSLLRATDPKVRQIVLKNPNCPLHLQAIGILGS